MVEVSQLPHGVEKGVNKGQQEEKGVNKGQQEGKKYFIWSV